MQSVNVGAPDPVSSPHLLARAGLRKPTRLRMATPRWERFHAAPSLQRSPRRPRHGCGGRPLGTGTKGMRAVASTAFQTSTAATIDGGDVTGPTHTSCSFSRGFDDSRGNEAQSPFCGVDICRLARSLIGHRGDDAQSSPIGSACVHRGDMLCLNLRDIVVPSLPQRR